nr:uncharacterized protein LOC127304243 [Lolium perenne]
MGPATHGGGGGELLRGDGGAAAGGDGELLPGGDGRLPAATGAAAGGGDGDVCRRVSGVGFRDGLRLRRHGLLGQEGGDDTGLTSAGEPAAAVGQAALMARPTDETVEEAVAAGAAAVAVEGEDWEGGDGVRERVVVDWVEEAVALL